MNYLVMECHTSYAILLDEQGRFVRAANLRYQVGQTVTNPVLMQEAPDQADIVPITAQPKRAGWRKRITGLVAAAACMLCLLVGYQQMYMTSYTAIAMSINPEVVMDLNRRGQVLQVRGVNEDGLALLQDFAQTSKDRQTVTEQLIQLAIEKGYLSAGGTIAFYIDTPDETLFVTYGTELRTNVTQYMSQRFAVDVVVKRAADRADGEQQGDRRTAEVDDDADDDLDREDLEDDDRKDGALSENDDDRGNGLPSEDDDDRDDGILSEDEDDRDEEEDALSEEEWAEDLEDDVEQTVQESQDGDDDGQQEDMDWDDSQDSEDNDEQEDNGDGEDSDL